VSSLIGHENAVQEAPRMEAPFLWSIFYRNQIPYWIQTWSSSRGRSLFFRAAIGPQAVSAAMPIRASRLPCQPGRGVVINNS